MTTKTCRLSTAKSKAKALGLDPDKLSRARHDSPICYEGQVLGFMQAEVFAALEGIKASQNKPTFTQWVVAKLDVATMEQLVNYLWVINLYDEYEAAMTALDMEKTQLSRNFS